VSVFLKQPDPPEALSDLLESVQDNDAYGLTRWYFLKDGRDEAPFAILRARYPEVWLQILGQIA
jgi:hypothetical protein